MISIHGIKIVISHLSDSLKATIQNAIEQNSIPEDQDNDNNYGILALPDDNNRQRINQIIEDILEI